MNANELADELANVGWNKPFSNWELLDQAATMLRQQQAEIEALKEQINKSQADIEYEADKAYWRNRTLTDQEIEEVFWVIANQKIDTPVLSFAKAILRKAQEK